MCTLFERVAALKETNRFFSLSLFFSSLHFDAHSEICTSAARDVELLHEHTHRYIDTHVPRLSRARERAYIYTPKSIDVHLRFPNRPRYMCPVLETTLYPGLQKRCCLCVCKPRRMGPPNESARDFHDQRIYALYNY